jgi:chaperonin cofactor prefoldin
VARRDTQPSRSRAAVVSAPAHAFRRAAALEALGQREDALRDYKDALRLNPTVSDALSGVRRLEAALGLPSSLKEAPAAGGRGGSGTRVTPSGAIQLSDEDQRTFAEVKGRVRDVQRQKMRAQAQAQGAAREKRQAELTLAQVQGLPEGTGTYRAVGRAFLSTPQPALHAILKEQLERAEGKLKVCGAALEHLEKQEKEADANFMELLTSFQKKAGRNE